MVLCVCKCLNVSLESDKVDDNADVGKLELTSMEQRDIFFSEKLMSCGPNMLKSQVVQPALVGQRAIGRGTLHLCLACGQNTHAMVQDKNGLIVALIPKSIETTQERINTYKKSKNFSPVFNLLVPEVTSDIDMKENMDTSNLIINEKGFHPPTHQVISTLSKHLKQSLQAQLETVEETVRQFRDQKYAEFDAYRERAHRDHKILVSIVNKARSIVDNNSWNTESGLQNGPPSPQVPPLQRRRLSSIKDAKKITSNYVKTSKDLLPDDDFLDAEEVFDLDDMNSRNDNMVSDSEEYNSDEGSNDEGIAITRARGGEGGGRGGGGGEGRSEIARSLPMNMPRFPNGSSISREPVDDEYEVPVDLAASIKALARSVHGDVFELPRPRVSTQI